MVFIDLKFLRKLAKSKKVVGLGETGLDYFYFKADTNIEAHKKIQRKANGSLKTGQRISR